MNAFLLWYLLRDKKEDDVLETPVDMMNPWVYYPMLGVLFAWICVCLYTIYVMASE